ncbi:glycosyltransferase [Solwaraspora sp. WMMD406]|uniref:glycosyltransferase n=1 Tax=Solwaraspora sp. WMMD406 TaxID=3016095 RepID=UPI0024175069|nr:glycosyltransferase [Solwaraspora sp. WMMD406]MDG4765262.1 glycosyltransferase [Solwaraspora sp. WMMD406]
MPVYFYWSGQDFDFGNLLAIASAAVHHPQIVVIVDETPRRNVWYDAVPELPGVRVERLDLDELPSVAHADLYRRMRFVAHRADLVRFGVLAARGGIYLDTDTLTCRPIASPGSRLLLRDDKIVHIGVIALPAGDSLANAMLDRFTTIPDKDLDVYQSVVYHWTDVVRNSPEAVTFGGLDDFFPVHWRDWEQIFQPAGFAGDPDRVTVLHHYGYFSRAYTRGMTAHWLDTHPCLFSSLARPLLDQVRDRLDVDLRQLATS